MIISPPFLPRHLTAHDETGAETDPLVAIVECYQLSHGIYPIAQDRHLHLGQHLAPNDQKEPVRAIADGEVVAWRVSQRQISDGSKGPDGRPVPNTNNGYVLLKHVTETGDGRQLTFYSLYMHLLDLNQQNRLVPQPAYQEQHDDTAPDRLSRWLLNPTDNSEDGAVQHGNGLKVRRKDQLGYVGACQGLRQLHFEVFMTEPDFESYFASTQLGELQPVTPEGSDAWGHTYYVIPGGTTYRSGPPEHFDSGYFPTLQDGKVPDDVTLYVECYFHKGDRYTRTWKKNADGRIDAITTKPEKDPYKGHYEYTLHRRASTINPDCPSDGYEMLRHGRVLSKAAVTQNVERNSENPDNTAIITPVEIWVAVMIAPDTWGYVEISSQHIQKLSDANFPFFKRWTKLDSNAPELDEDGLWHAAGLHKLTDDPRPLEDYVGSPQYSKDEETRLSKYLCRNPELKEKITGLICHAVSEWDSKDNSVRYRHERDAATHAEASNDGGSDDYANLIAFVRKLQIPIAPIDDGKLWFFHPLGFIRHFRRNLWLSLSEFEQIYRDEFAGRGAESTISEMRDKYIMYINMAIRKYGLDTRERLTHFLGQGAIESNFLRSMQETSMLGTLQNGELRGRTLNLKSQIPESELGHWYGSGVDEDDAWFRSKKFTRDGAQCGASYAWRFGNCDPEDPQKFRGRGYKQLTFRSNYADYWSFRGWISKNSFSPFWWDDRSYKDKNREAMRSIPAVIDDPQKVALPEHCIDAAGFFVRVVKPSIAKLMDEDASVIWQLDARNDLEIGKSNSITKLINGGLSRADYRLKITRVAKDIIC